MIHALLGMGVIKDPTPQPGDEGEFQRIRPSKLHHLQTFKLIILSNFSSFWIIEDTFQQLLLGNNSYFDKACELYK